MSALSATGAAVLLELEPTTEYDVGVIVFVKVLLQVSNGTERLIQGE